ncbi:O-antigen polymerase [Vibrio nigripulchritudo ATCC 27043]|uniref:O-antigen ligase family protein n=1 Tax=Vibrio nigripulchritudo TaxID=28173 RepID=UPI00021C1C08|nr:O-antigen ligase family protein [Vibrio nigripulchritudo]EGU56721.1 O-antigen polymerase [Vibrio nigripulchritudo ATCC 27043]
MSRDKVAKILDSEKFILLMVFSACIYATFKDSWRLFADIFQTFLLLVSLVTLIVHWSFFKKEKLLWLLPVALIAQLSSWLYSLHFYPELATDSPQVGRLLEFFVFFFIAFWLRGNKKYIWTILSCFVFGSIFTLNYHAPILEEISIGLSGKRVDFNYRNAQHGALIIGSALIVHICYFVVSFSSNFIERKKTLIHTILILTLSVILIVMQTRQTFLGLTLGVLISVIYFLSIYNKLTIKIILKLIIILSLILLLSINTDIIYQRLKSELFVITDYIVTGDFSNAPNTSIGVRAQLWYESTSWIEKSPLIGLGNGIEKFLIESSTRLPSEIIERYKHMHSSYVATLLRFGIVGLVLSLAIFIIPITHLFKISNNSQVTRYVKCLAVIFLVYWLVVNTFESFWYMKAGLWTYTVFMAAIYTIPLSQRYEKYQASLKR